MNTMRYDFKKIEPKWQKKWEEEKSLSKGTDANQDETTDKMPKE